MKKTSILIAALFIYLLGVTTLLFIKQKKQEEIAQERYQAITIGAPDAGQGESLYSAFTKINSNFSAHDDSLALRYRKTETQALISDSIQALKNAALSASSYFWELTDTGYTYKQIITWNQLQAAISEVEGGGTASAPYVLQFTIGSTAGAPANGDSTLYHNDFIDKPVFLWRGTGANMTRQRYNATTRNGVTGYRQSNDTIIVRPAFATGETVLIEARDSVEYLNFGTSTLLSGLLSYWKLDETSGTTAYDAHATNNGIISAGVTINQTGAIGKAYDFNGTSSNVNIGKVCQPTEAISISLWFNTADISSTQWMFGNGVYSTNWCGYWISINSAGEIMFALGTNTATMLEKYYGSGLDNGSWHHVVATWNGSNAYIYVDNVKSTATAYTSDIVYVTANNLRFGSNAYGDGAFYGGLIDEPAIWNRALTDSEVATLYEKSPYPFVQ